MQAHKSCMLIDNESMWNVDIVYHTDDSNRNVRKLQKPNHRANRKSISVKSMDSSHTTLKGDGSASDYSSLRRCLSSFMSSPTLASHQKRPLEDGIQKRDGRRRVSRTSTKSDRKSDENEEDPLPETKKELEIRLNYHLSELDMLKRTIRSANDVITQAQDRLTIFQTRATPDITVVLKMQREMIQIALGNRDNYFCIVKYHNKELERIKEKRIKIEEAAGLEGTLPEVYKKLWGAEEWSYLFSTGQ